MQKLYFRLFLHIQVTHLKDLGVIERKNLYYILADRLLRPPVLFTFKADYCQISCTESEYINNCKKITSNRGHCLWQG